MEPEKQRFHLPLRKKADLYLEWLESRNWDDGTDTVHTWIGQNMVVLAHGTLSEFFSSGFPSSSENLSKLIELFGPPDSVSLETLTLDQLAKRWDEICKLEYEWDCHEGGDGIHETLESWDIESICVCGWNPESVEQCEEELIKALKAGRRRVPSTYTFTDGDLWWPSPSGDPFAGKIMTLYDIVGYGDTCTYTMMGREYIGDGIYKANQAHWRPGT